MESKCKTCENAITSMGQEEMFHCVKTGDSYKAGYCIKNCSLYKEKTLVNEPTRPNHYKINENGFECWDYIDMVCPKGEFYIGNVMKYITRYNQKNGLEDLKKARVYLERLIRKIENGEIKMEG